MPMEVIQNGILSPQKMVHRAFYEINMWKCANILGFSKDLYSINPWVQ